MIDFQSRQLLAWKKAFFLEFHLPGLYSVGWFFLVQPFMLLIYYICGLAETTVLLSIYRRQNPNSLPATSPSTVGSAGWVFSSGNMAI